MSLPQLGDIHCPQTTVHKRGFIAAIIVFVAAVAVVIGVAVFCCITAWRPPPPAVRLRIGTGARNISLRSLLFAFRLSRSSIERGPLPIPIPPDPRFLRPPPPTLSPSVQHITTPDSSSSRSRNLRKLGLEVLTLSRAASPSESEGGRPEEGEDFQP